MKFDNIWFKKFIKIDHFEKKSTEIPFTFNKQKELSPKTIGMTELELIWKDLG